MAIHIKALSGFRVCVCVSIRLFTYSEATMRNEYLSATVCAPPTVSFVVLHAFHEIAVPLCIGTRVHRKEASILRTPNPHTHHSTIPHPSANSFHSPSGIRFWL
jgi:hypothetical protein